MDKSCSARASVRPYEKNQCRCQPRWGTGIYGKTTANDGDVGGRGCQDHRDGGCMKVRISVTQKYWRDSKWCQLWRDVHSYGVGDDARRKLTRSQRSYTHTRAIHTSDANTAR
jgi:hypothetical protein